MLLIILALFWVAVLAPTVVRRFRDNGTERSIDSFHAEHQVLSRQEYAVAPAHRLDQDERETTIDADSLRKPRLTVVHADDTYRSLESRGSWDEWSEDYNYDDEPTNRRASTKNRYAAAYSSVPRPSQATTTRATYEPVLRRRSMKAQRKMMFGRLVLGAIALTIISFVSGISFLTDIAIASWFCVVAFVALALYSVSQGYLEESSLPLRLPQRSPLATIQPLYDEYPVQPEEEFASDFYEDDSNVRWQRESQSRSALG
jgi:hypothetical protein